MKQIYHILLAVLWLLCPLSSGADNVIIEHYAEKDGLPSNSVNCALKGSEGFLWFGTWHGLSRFDGTRFYNYSSSLGQGLNSPPQKIETMVEDVNGNLWLKTSDWKLFVFLKKEERFQLVADDIKPYTRNIQIIKIQQGADGGVLLLTKSKELLQANTDKDGRVKIVRLIDSQAYVDRNYRLLRNIVGENQAYIFWQGADYSIACVKKGVERMLVPQTDYVSFHVVGDLIYLTRQDGAVTTVDIKRGITDSYDGPYPFRKELSEGVSYIDSQGNAWNIDNNSIYRYNIQTGTSELYPITFFGRVCDAKIVEVPGRGLIFLTSGGDIYIYNNVLRRMRNFKEYDYFRQSDSKPSFFDVFCDEQGVIWLSSAQNGIYKIYYPQNLFSLITLPGFDTANGVRTIYQQANGDVLVGLRDKTMLRLDRHGTLKNRYTYDDYHIGSVYYIMTDRSGNIWLSTKGDGIALMIPDNTAKDGFRISRYLPNADDKWSLSGRDVYMTYQDTRGHIWVCTLDGGLNLVVLDNGRIRFANKYNAFSRYPQYGQYMEVRNIVEDASGRLWIGTIDGLMSIDSRFTDYRNINFETYHNNEVSALVNSDVYSMYKSKQGNIWLSSFGCGVGQIASYDTVRHMPIVRPIDQKVFGPNTVALSINEDFYRRMWFSFAKSLAYYDGRIAQVRMFSAADGLPDVDFEETSSLANSNGEMWFGCKQGILVYKGGKRSTTTDAYPTRIVGLRIGNKDYRTLKEDPVVEGSITGAKEITLTHRQNTFTLEFAALTYTHQGNISYRYKMEGLDNEWHNTGTTREVSFNNLPAGHYVLTIETINSDSPDTKSFCTLRITVLSPIWARWWAVLLYICIIGGLLLWLRKKWKQRHTAYTLPAQKEVQLPSEDYLKLLEDKDRQFVDQLNGIIDNNIFNPEFSVNTIPQTMGISRSAFFKHLKEVTDLAPVDYIKEYRLLKSVTLMRTTDLGVTEIAYHVGFNNSSYFTKCFRKRFGKTPREYLLEIRKSE